MTAAEFTQRAAEETGRVILGKREQTELILMTLLAGGHVLLEDLPGVGKTTLVKSIAAVSGCEYKRIQFVPDLMPSDITGMNIYDRQSGEFRFLPGPVFCHILLADEINRAVPRTQAALLEAMEERTVTIDGVSRPLQEPFMVLATQNPVESESTFRLPAAQMDRFLIRLHMGYPAPAEEKEMLALADHAAVFGTVSSIGGPEMLRELRAEVESVRVADAAAEYIVAVTAATRSAKGVAMGASPRATKALYRASRAWAAMHGRSFVTPDDVQYLAPHVLAHRLLMSSEARLSGLSAEQVIAEVLASVPVPPQRSELFDA